MIPNLTTRTGMDLLDAATRRGSEQNQKQQQQQQQQQQQLVKQQQTQHILTSHVAGLADADVSAERIAQSFSEAELRLRVASAKGDDKATALLLRYGTNPDACDPDLFYSGEAALGATCLGLASAHGHAAVVGALLAAGADANGDNWLELGATKAIHLAAQGSLHRRWRRGDPEQATTAGGHLEVVRLLLAHGADARARSDPRQPGTTLHFCHDAAVVRFLLAADAVDAEARNAVGWTRLESAAADGEVDVAAALLDSGDSGAALAGSAALHIAAALGHAGMVRLLVARGADLEARDAHGRTALHAAIFPGALGECTAETRAATVAVLLELGASQRAPCPALLAGPPHTDAPPHDAPPHAGTSSDGAWTGEAVSALELAERSLDEFSGRGEVVALLSSSADRALAQALLHDGASRLSPAKDDPVDARPGVGSTEVTFEVEVTPPQEPEVHMATPAADAPDAAAAAATVPGGGGSDNPGEHITGVSCGKQDEEDSNRVVIEGAHGEHGAYTGGSSAAGADGSRGSVASPVVVVVASAPDGLKAEVSQLCRERGYGASFARGAEDDGVAGDGGGGGGVAAWRARTVAAAVALARGAAAVTDNDADTGRAAAHALVSTLAPSGVTVALYFLGRSRCAWELGQAGPLAEDVRRGVGDPALRVLAHWVSLADLRALPPSDSPPGGPLDET